MSFYIEYFQELNKKISMVDEQLLEKSVDLITNTSKKGKKVIIIGNGGSAAMASHVAVDLTKNAGIRSINFNEADLLTCFSNDYGYEEWVKYALEFYADKGDLGIFISSSGSSKNIINGAMKAKILGMEIITLSGFSQKNILRNLGNINLFVESRSYNIVEMTHHIWLLAIVDRIIGKVKNENISNRE